MTPRDGIPAARKTPQSSTPCSEQSPFLSLAVCDAEANAVDKPLLSIKSKTFALSAFALSKSDAFSGRAASVSLAMAITASSEASQIAVAAMNEGLSNSPLVAGTALFKSTITVAVPSSLVVTN